jgi:hypothetical protein
MTLSSPENFGIEGQQEFEQVDRFEKLKSFINQAGELDMQFLIKNCNLLADEFWYNGNSHAYASKDEDELASYLVNRTEPLKPANAFKSSEGAYYVYPFAIYDVDEGKIIITGRVSSSQWASVHSESMAWLIYEPEST